jgi:hypothetical protein
MEQNQDASPVRLLHGILRRRYDDASSRFKDKEFLAIAAREIAKSYSGTFRDNPIDRETYKKLLNIHTSRTFELIKEFRDFCRGFADSDTDDVIVKLDPDKKRYVSLVDGLLAKNAKKIRVLVMKRRMITVKLLQENQRELEGIKRWILEVFDDPIQAAKQKLRWIVARRRYSRFDSISPADDFLRLAVRFHRQNPDVVTNPLRFLAHIPAREYDLLEQKWLKGATRDELILSFDDDAGDDKTFFDQLRGVTAKIEPALRVTLEPQINELEKVWASKCYTAATLLAIAQVEGILWDYAKYLNRRGILIFKTVRSDKPRYYPYERDHDRKRYKIGSETKKRPLRTARDLLQATRLGNILWKGLYSYLIDEFYDDRNQLMHGRFYQRNLRADAIGAMLCYSACLFEVGAKLKFR